jgi:hypothetical protein
MEWNEANKDLTINKRYSLDFFRSFDNQPVKLKRHIDGICYKLYDGGLCVHVLAYDKNEVVGHLDTKFDSRYAYPVEKSVWVSIPSQGIGYTMYEILLSVYKGIISDTEFTGKNDHGVFDIWEKLSKTYKPSIVNYNRDIKSINKIMLNRVLTKNDIMDKGVPHVPYRFLVEK